MKRLLAVVAGLAVALIGSVAVAAWLSSGAGGSMVTATTVNQANAPTATRGAGKVDLSWTASTLANGTAVGGYRVVRHSGSDTTTVCTVAALACSDNAPVGTQVTYGVIGTIGTSWTGPESAPTAFTYDATAPEPPTFAGISADTGSSSTDRITNVAAQTLSGTAEANSTVVVKKNATTVCTVTANGSGAFSCAVTLATGANVYTATATDAANNTSSASATFTVTLDQTTATPTFTGISADTGSSSTDQITKTAAQTLSGTAEASSTVVVKKGATTECTTTANGAGVFTCSVTLAAGTNTYTATATDTAGNAATSVIFTVTLDQTTATPTFTGISNDTGTAGDRVTNVASQNLLGTAESNSSVVVTRGGVTVCTVTAASGAFSCPVTLNSGANLFSATATDAAGNISASSSTFTVTLKQSTVTPVFTGISDDTGSSSSDEITKASSQTLLGTAEAGASVTVKKAGVPQPVCSNLTVDGSGAFNCLVTLTEGTNSYTATVTDVAGNNATSSPLLVTLDSTNPTFGAIEPGNESGGWAAIACSVSGSLGKPCAVVTDNQSVASVTMSLTKSNNRCWDGGSSSAFVLGTCPVVATSLSGGVWATSNTLSRSGGSGQGNFTDTTYTLAVTATDTAGNAVTTTRSFSLSGS